MDEDMMRLYEAFSNYATDNLFWSLVYLNNAVFHTPLKEDAKNKLISLNKTYGTILSSIYPLDKSRDLITAMGNNNQLFIIYPPSFCSTHTVSNFRRNRCWRPVRLRRPHSARHTP